ncbi:class I SAM-dependent methyltransferase [Sedimenticola selenatireducens]|uniref:Class I SAM-dependent methyltransferase n=1 Tax=Sedimenticola selenatireducens TaxID=191960 RepID=A0A557S4T3_9GAMM|nr:class I SAM-dependent methyltransferase [Sedimenticola selenatireducens]TVO72430.1 class I SAM-dependent methyltransferase [Sedimenticola selenatireducens]TVT64685.1 MAG: class I SAM-dependent methyltransferase [Sedimenticola selenatireducens]
MLLCPNCRSSYPEHATECRGCGWKLEEIEGIKVFLSNSDKQDNFFKEYIENYREISINDIHHGFVDTSYLENQADKLLNYYTGKHEDILEVGVGQGFLLRKLRERYQFSRITAVDISLPFLTNALKQIDVNCLFANAENLPFSNAFDLIVASDILEHVINPIDFLLSSNYSLKSDGCLVLRVPFEDNMLQYSKLLGCKYKFAHLRNFSKRNLVVMLSQAGFKVTQIHYDGYYAYSRRPPFRRGVLKNIFEYCINSVYPNENDVSKIPNWIGLMLMKPLEIVIVAKKDKNVSDMNYLF